MTALPNYVPGAFPAHPAVQPADSSTDEQFYALLDNHLDLTDGRALRMLIGQCPAHLRPKFEALLRQHAAPEVRCDIGS
jgi:hypothetical protein